MLTFSHVSVAGDGALLAGGLARPPGWQTHQAYTLLKYIRVYAPLKYPFLQLIVVINYENDSSENGAYVWTKTDILICLMHLFK